MKKKPPLSLKDLEQKRDILFKIKEDVPVVATIEKPEVSMENNDFSKYEEYSDPLAYDAIGCLRYYLPSIDKFMIELANNSSHLDKIAGLIIAGQGGDGAYGLQKIKAAGGNTAVQLPDECICNSMPNAALQLEPNHHKVCISSYDCEFSLRKWLLSIK